MRIISATNKDLETEIEKGRFREDLWYRLNVFPITAPPLRQRIDDIPLLVEHFVTKSNRKHGRQIQKIPVQLIKTLRQYTWPGNVRELENVIERAVVVSKGTKLELAEPILSTAGKMKSPEADETLEQIEREYILGILQKTDWRIEGPKGATRILGLKPSTLRSRMQKLGIRKP